MGRAAKPPLQCIGKIEHGIDIFGITKGDFSMIDHIATEIGLCSIDVGTWTAANADIKHAEYLFECEKIK